MPGQVADGQCLQRVPSVRARHASHKEHVGGSAYANDAGTQSVCSSRVAAGQAQRLRRRNAPKRRDLGHGPQHAAQRA